MGGPVSALGFDPRKVGAAPTFSAISPRGGTGRRASVRYLCRKAGRFECGRGDHCSYGGIGIHGGLKYRCESVGVRVALGAPYADIAQLAEQRIFNPLAGVQIPISAPSCIADIRIGRASTRPSSQCSRRDTRCSRHTVKTMSTMSYPTRRSASSITLPLSEPKFQLLATSISFISGQEYLLLNNSMT